ncbi:hypothetical protein AJ78_06734 [Emergomyces pasteurianus Ep9510]|uniref:Uncharacterized protein n=1 Tax=Emergomyces pasteurianus Ep9510 TaxID=1447872 RepID=A0A1J9P8D5_9EURO|nr:hypothetical protein AJ78_06734 [Emergomyces pasteurianus Ep9510]
MADIEDAAIVPPGRAIMGRQLDKWMWCIPRAHTEGPIADIYLPSDTVAFGILLNCDVKYAKRQTRHLHRQRKVNLAKNSAPASWSDISRTLQMQR